MEFTNFVEVLKGKRELVITVRGRKTMKTHSAPVWFVQEGNRMYLLPLRGSDTNWYKNFLQDRNITLTIGERSVQVKAEAVTKSDRVKRVIDL